MNRYEQHVISKYPPDLNWRGVIPLIRADLRIDIDSNRGGTDPLATRAAEAHKAECNRDPETGDFPAWIWGHLVWVSTYTEFRALRRDDENSADYDYRPNPHLMDLQAAKDLEYREGLACAEMREAEQWSTRDPDWYEIWVQDDGSAVVKSFMHNGYPPSSVLYGQTLIRFVDAFTDVEAAQMAYPEAQFGGPYTSARNSVSHLPDGPDDI